MRKLIGTIVGLVVVVYLVYQFLGTQLVASALQSSLGVPVKVSRIHVKPVPFEVGAYGVKIFNPKGFEEKEMVSIPELFVRVNLGSLFKRVIQVQKINVNLEHVTVEKSKAGRINLKDLLDLAKSKPAPGKPGPSQPTQAPTPQKPKPTAKKGQPFFKLQIDEVTTSIGRVSFVDYGSGQRKVREFPMNVDRMVLHNVTDLDSLTEELVMIVLKKIGLFVMGMQFDKILTDVQGKFSNLFA